MDTPFNPYLIAHTLLASLSLSSKRRQKKELFLYQIPCEMKEKEKNRRGRQLDGSSAHRHTSLAAAHTQQASSFSLSLSRCFAAKKLVITSVELPVSRASFVQPVAHLRPELHFDPHRHLP
jgi:hypothetical protein